MDEFSRCRGIRVFYYPYDYPTPSQNEGKGKSVDIINDHKHQWKDYQNEPREVHLEAGTVTSVVLHKNERGKNEFLTVIQWDCGLRRSYCELELKNIRVFDLGPTGFKGEQVICDICCEPVMGYAWTLASTQTEDFLNLCCTHYNKYRDLYSKHKFCTYIPGYDVEPKQTRDIRGQINLYGLFKGAKVKRLEKDINCEGTILRISHSKEEGNRIQADVMKADYFKCCAEVLWSENGPPDFNSVACKGIVDLKAVIPVSWMEIYADHHPILGEDLFRKLATFKSFEITETSLKLPCRNLKTIPSDLDEAKLRLLKTVNIYNNEIHDLPATLKNASELAVFCGQYNCFDSFPEVLLNLKKLTTLNLHGNYLSDFPSEIHRSFNHLHRLILSSNDLSYLPDIFDKLPVLSEASFAHNQLTVLPGSFKNLSKLRILNLSYNAIVRFPVALFDGMRELKYLDLKYNRIQKLPGKMPELRDLFKQLKRIKLKGNPIYLHDSLLNKSILEVLQTEDVLTTLSKVELVRSLRICVLGNKDSGKTSLARSVCYDQYVVPSTEYQHKCTMGIDVHYSTFALQSDCMVPLHVWDHAGQNEYDMLNELSIVDDALLWIVVSLEKYRCTTESFKDQVLKWIYPILLRSTDPQVWIVGTHFDRTSSESKLNDIKRRFKEFCDDYKGCLIKVTMLNNADAQVWGERQNRVIKCLANKVNYFELSNTYKFEKRNCLYKAMKEKLKLGQTLSAEWETAMHDEVHQKCSFDSNLVHILNLDSLMPNPDLGEFLHYCCGIGEVYKMESKSTKMVSREDKFVTNIKWLITRLRKIYCNPEQQMQCIPKRNLGIAIKMLTDYGAISLAFLSKVWTCQGLLSRQSLVSFLIESSLAFKFELRNEDEYLFFPYLIKSEEIPHTEECIQIQIECEYQFSLPCYFLQRLALLLARNSCDYKLAIGTFEVETKDKDGRKLNVWGSKIASTVEFSDCIKLQVKYPDASYYSSTPKFYENLWEVVADALESIEMLMIEEFCHFEMHVYVLCPCCKKDRNSVKLICVPKKGELEHLHTQKKKCQLCKSKVPLYEIVPHLCIKMSTPMSQEEFSKEISENWKDLNENPEGYSSASSSQYSNEMSQFLMEGQQPTR